MLKYRFTALANAVQSKFNHRLWLASAVIGIAACGGGGGDAASSNAGTTPAPAPAAPGYTLSGQVNIAENNQVDSDVNDPNAVFTGNNTFDTAQTLPNPARLGGYANVAGQGPEGRSKAAGDRSDAFRINATAGQTVSLLIGQPRTGDLDLYLYDDNRTLLAQSIGTGKDESITIPTTGRYYIQVFADSGASAYVLTLGQNATASSADDGLQLQSTAQFVPGEVIVQWKPGTQARAGSSLVSAAAATLSTHALSVMSEAETGPTLLKITDPVSTLSRAAHPDMRALAQNSGSVTSEDNMKAATLESIKRLRSDPNVAYAEPNYIRQASAIPNDPSYPLQWHYPLINLPTAWDITQGSNSVIVAVVDTGVLLNHPEMLGQTVPGYDFVSSPSLSNDGGGIDDNPNDPGDKVGGGSSFHGTHVAGTIAAASNNRLGVAGVAPNARIMPIRALGIGGGTSFDITQGVLFAAGLPNSSNTVPARRADIINLSLGGNNGSAAEQDAFNRVRAQGVMVVAAAGNDNTATPAYPASYDNVISVSAVNINRARARYSNFGSRVDVAAPGGDTSVDLNGDGRPDGIYSLGGDDRSGTIVYGAIMYAGTSMATPHVSGVLALMKTVRPALTPAEVDGLLVAGRLTIDLGPPGRDDNFGHGLIDALKAVQAAQGNTTVPGILLATPTVINLAPNISTQTITLSNGGTQALQTPTVQVSPANATWLSVTPPTSTDGLGTYTLRVNRANLVPGAYSASVRFTSGTMTASVTVIMQVTTSGANPAANLGEHYILLFDKSTGRPIQQVQARVANGTYKFEFKGVPAGKYLLQAGSDADNNNIIGDLGEAGGAYLNLTEPVTLNVTGNMTGLDFDSGFLSTISSASAQSTGGLREQPSLAKRLR